MVIVQINMFICELCGKTTFVSSETSLYSDPVVEQPANEEWDYVELKHGQYFACPDCLKRYGNNE